MSAGDESAATHNVVARGFVRGLVQGVWFRESTRRRAVELGLSGFVRNLPDGRVEAEFVGPIAAVKLARTFIEQGPPQARVDQVEGFEIEDLALASEPAMGEFLVR